MHASFLYRYGQDTLVFHMHAFHSHNEADLMLSEKH